MRRTSKRANTYASDNYGQNNAEKRSVGARKGIEPAPHPVPAVGHRHAHCCKSFPIHDSFMPGVLVGCCGCSRKHIFYLGIQDSGESVQMPFEVLKRFGKMPRVVVYDFACGLELYAREREPYLFAQTMFLVDKFHTSNHIQNGNTTCSRNHFFRSYNNEFVSGINSEGAEQINNELRRIAPSLHYFELQRGLVVLSVFAHVHNADKVSISPSFSQTWGRTLPIVMCFCVCRDCRSTSGMPIAFRLSWVTHKVYWLCLGLLSRAEDLNFTRTALLLSSKERNPPRVMSYIELDCITNACGAREPLQNLPVGLAASCHILLYVADR